MWKLFFLLFMSLFVNAQDRNSFYIKNEYQMSDFNYIGIANIDEYQNDSIMDSVFNVKPGIYTIRIYERTSSSDTKIQDNLKDNLELIIVKILNTQIIESYYCPLSWKEPPISRVLLHSNEKIKLKNRIPIKKLKFQNVYDDGFEIYLNGFLINKD